MMLNNLRKGEGDRPGSVPPSLPASKSAPLNNRPSSIPPGDFAHRRISSDVRNAQKGQTSGNSLDLMAHLQRSGPSVVKTRTGSVLSRGFILKTDHYPSGRALDLELNVHGAPNFRAPRIADLNVFGVAQPRTQGLRAILSVLRCRPGTPDPSHVIWFSTREEPIVYISGRPFVLRDASQPRRTLLLSDRAENLEAIENRLKNDILQEAVRYGSLLLTHNEDISGAILPTWTSVDASNVKTSLELWGEMKEQGWNVDVGPIRVMIPIAPDRPIEDNYLDAYLRVIRTTDPLRTALVFSCGMGAVRTTFAMVAASIVRRRQLIVRGLADPYAIKSNGPSTPVPIGTPTGGETESKIMQALEQANAQQDLSRSLLRLTYLLQQCFPPSTSGLVCIEQNIGLQNRNSQSAIELLMTHPALLDNLRKAHMGNYGVILSLLGCLDHGLRAKRLVDRVIDATDHVTNLREDILMHRLKYSMTSMDEAKGEDFLDKAVKALEKYFFAIAFASYVDGTDDFSQTFSNWLKTRTEIWNQIKFLRKSYGSRLNVFGPINDLSALSKTNWEDRTSVPGRKNDVAIAGGQILGDEYSNHVVKNRSGIILREGTLLKSDQWLQESHHVEHDVRGAINFRRVPTTNIYALGQPTLEAINEVISRIKTAHPSAQRIIWITLREEPIVYINGAPYCLRREGFSLRNMKDYGGISPSRLEILEERLRDDVISELKTFGGRLLLHSESNDGSVIPVWEEIQNELEDVVVLKDVMASYKVVDGLELDYHRIPMTAERPPDFSDLQDLVDVILASSSNTPIVVNCQLGRGRSTTASIVLLLIRQWLESRRLPTTPTTPWNKRSLSMMSLPPMDPVGPPRNRHSYQIINNLLRVIRKGLRVKSTVDDAIDRADIVYNLRDAIEEARTRADQATDDKEKRKHAQKGLQNLHRYFALIVFQAYLQSTEPDTRQSFETIETFVKSQPVIKTFENELFADGLNSLKPLERAEVTDGVAHPDEVNQIVVNRSGNILSASTILKNDMFLNLQKMTLPERIDGAPNFRRVPLTLRSIPSPSSSPNSSTDPCDEKMVCGSGMPTVEGLRRALLRVDAGPTGKNKVFWTSLREEPVIYIAGSPHVLRLAANPLENVEATGVTTAMVEQMEESFKKDVLWEVRANEGRVLLHDEVEERPGSFAIVPLWETVSEADILTPRDVFSLMKREGFKIDYGRIAVTDEQAPLPDALSQLFDRVTSGMSQAGDFVFNCQMGRGRTTTGMVAACLISTTMNWHGKVPKYEEDIDSDAYDSMDGPSEEEAYLQGEYKTILQLVGVLSYGKLAKRLADRAIDLMQDVQNLRKAIYDYKLKVDACEKGSVKENKLRNVTVNYLYRYGSLIVFANYLIGLQDKEDERPATFTDWLREHREITKLLGRRSLD
ncbi:inositol hexakisphosphate-domain-containing protein [Mycena metata]|uniref:Inositol hexakisphosphate-domain-containing protein n=1 Tax=Mycena metata TaxID=1033252 RepID=A0AAD7NLM6_9AGAR|nr:inositol hexakisphosphate-domain-containing protein [Mycena metata]